MGDVLKFVEGQVDGEKMYKAPRERRYAVLGLSVFDKRHLLKELMSGFKAKYITPTKIGDNKYGEVVHYEVDGEMLMLEVQVVAQPRSSAQHAAPTEKIEPGEEWGEVTVRFKTDDAGGITAVLAILNDTTSQMGDLEKCQTKLERQNRAPREYYLEQLKRCLAQ